MDVRQTWTDCDKAGDYVVPKVLSPRDLVSRPDNIDKTVPHTEQFITSKEVILSWFSLLLVMGVFSKM